MSGELTRTVNGSEANSTTATPLLKRGAIPVIGYPGPMFAVIHLSALVVLSVSTTVSTGLMVYLCGCHRCCCRSSKSLTDTDNGKHQSGKPSGNGVPIRAKEVADVHGVSNTGQGNLRQGLDTVATKRNRASIDRRDIGSFWKWNVGERFVLYIAISDISFGISHIFDHAYMFHTKNHPPDLLCSVFAFLLHEFSLAQWLVVVISAVSACSLVVFGRKFSLGRWDWRLLVFAFLVPCVVGLFGIKFRLLGASGAWCYVNLATEAGRRYHNVITVCLMSLYGIITLAYGAIWFKIKRTERLMRLPSGTRYQNSAVVMLIFVGVFTFQWSSFTLYNFWVLTRGNPPTLVLVLPVILVNLGGVYNCFAYTVVRRRIQKSGGNRVVVVVSGQANTGRTVRTPDAMSLPSGNTEANTTANDNNGDVGQVSASSTSNTSPSSKFVPFEIYI